MQMMVEQQAETLNQIEQHAESTVVELEQGNRDIEKAIVIAKSTRGVSLLFAYLSLWFSLIYYRKNGSVSSFSSSF